MEQITQNTLRQDKLHELLELALDDLAKCESQPDKFRIDMDDWLYRDGEICAVCLAGATMAQRLLGGNLPYEGRTPWGFDNETGNLLKALDKLRRGYVAEAYELVNGRPAPDDVCELVRKVPHYHESREAWWDAMRQLLADLRSANI